jgi:hypothetical protein
VNLSRWAFERLRAASVAVGANQRQQRDGARAVALLPAAGRLARLLAAGAMALDGLRDGDAQGAGFAERET